MLGAALDPDATDAVGQSVFWSTVQFEMSRQTKQTEAVVSDLDASELAEAVEHAAEPRKEVKVVLRVDEVGDTYE